MKFSFVEGVKCADAFAEVVPDDEAMVAQGLVFKCGALLVKSTKMAVQRHVRQENLPREDGFAF
jgi:hypothetical protein